MAGRQRLPASPQQRAEIVRQARVLKRGLTRAVRATEWSVWLETDGRIDSRWGAAGQTVAVEGPDWRVAA